MIHGKTIAAAVATTILCVAMISRANGQDVQYSQMAQAASYQVAAEEGEMSSSEATTTVVEDAPLWWRLRTGLQEKAPYLYGCDPCQPIWTATADAVVMHRSPSGRQPLLYDSGSQSYLLDAADLKYNYSVGPRLSLIRHGICDCIDIELNYFSIEGWNAVADYPAGTLPLPFAVLTLDQTLPLPVNAVRFEERSRLYSSELNARLPLSGRLNVYSGFRWIELYDGYQAQGTEAVLSTDFSHSVRAYNHLYGFQVGADIDFFQRGRQVSQFGPTTLVCDQCSPISLKGFAKSGVYYNAADQGSEFSNPDYIGTLWASDSGSHTAFVGEIGLLGCYQFNEHISVRAGYQVMWIEGVALAAEQIASTNFGGGVTALDTRGSLFYHGAIAGLELNW